MPESFINSLKSLQTKYWYILFIQMFERLTYSALLLQISVYIAQKDLAGGLHFEQTDKGTIFFIWALIQNLTPVLTGGFADKYGRKKLLIIAVLIASAGYFAAGFQRDFYPFLISVSVIGFGLGLYRPAIYGMIAGSISERNTSVAWGLNVMTVNLAFFFAPALAKYFEEISWLVFFSGLGLIMLLSIIPIFFIKEEIINSSSDSNSNILKETLQELVKPQVIQIILIMSGFMMIYLQFYETLPNFISDWVNTSDLVNFFHLPKFLLTSTPSGIMLDFKYLYNLNSGLILIGVVFVTWLVSGLRMTTGLIIGISLATLGLAVSGWSQFGFITVCGMLVYTLGEMIANPKYNEFMAAISPSGKKSSFMGYLALSSAIGFSVGAKIGGYVYKYYGEKSGLAIDYLKKHFNLTEGINHSNSMDKLVEITRTNHNAATTLLWNEYHPFQVWYVFILIGIVSLTALYFYSKRYKQV